MMVHSPPRRTRRTRRTAVASACTLAVVGTFVAASPAIAADSYPPSGDHALAATQPKFPGYRVADILNWTPDSDPDAQYLRARVPLQPRIDPLAATQANPALESKADVLLMQGDYGNEFFGATPYSSTFAHHTLNFWQYTDIFAPWHGATPADIPAALYDPVTSDWRDRKFEFGSVNIPNPSYTNAAHRNGALSIATIYFDPAFRPGVSVDELLMKQNDDGTYPVADKLIEMAKYYGYDGYFFNKEEYTGTPVEKFKDFMAYLTTAGMYTNFYDTNSYIDEEKTAWLKDDTRGRIHDSVFVNYDWPRWAGHAEEWDDLNATYGDDLYKNFFLGVEANQGKFSGGHITASQFENIYLPGTKNPRTSVALFTPSDFYQRSLDDEFSEDVRATESVPLMQTNEYQWMITERERMYFSGVKEDVTATGDQAGYSRPDVGAADASAWVGVADFTPERSVIGGSTFHSSFNTGHGMSWWDAGTDTTAGEWTNITAQSILPSWQWWFETASGKDSALTADFDYGTALTRKDMNGQPTATPFSPVGAYAGGSSLAIYGDIAEPTTMRLFKSDIAVEKKSRATVAFQKVAGDVDLSLGVVFADAPTETVTFPLSNARATGNWSTANVDLGKHSGRSIASLAIVLDGEATGAQVNVGALTIGTGAKAPAAPKNFAVTNLYANEALLAWDIADFSAVDSYEVYASRGGARTFLGATYDSVLHVDGLADIEGNDKLRFELVAVGKNGAKSKAAVSQVKDDRAVSALSVATAPDADNYRDQATTAGQFDVSWTLPATSAGRKNIRIDAVARNMADPVTASVTVGANATSAVLPIADAEGREYDITVTSIGNHGRVIDGGSISVRALSHDSYSAPYALDDLVLEESSWRIMPPSPRDWQKLTLAVDGVDQFTAIRGNKGPNAELLTWRDYPEGAELSIVLTDDAGNVSEPLVVGLPAR